MSLPPDLGAALESFATEDVVLVASDFDGVLAPLVLNPMEARAVEGAVEALEELAGLPGTHTAVVSGRDLATLTELTELSESSVVTLIGSHGAESSIGTHAERGLDDDRASTLRALTADLADVVESHPGARLEHKPTATVLHTRGQQPAAAEAATTAALEVAGRHSGVRVMRGKSIVEMSVVEADKGSALMALKDSVGADRLAYFGDDVTDEDVFALLGEGDVGVKIGAGETRAKFRVEKPQDVAEALTTLLERRSAAQA
jgi:trehalose 6-phosphate phosphatase